MHTNTTPGRVAAIALGSNLGEREAHLRRALDSLAMTPGLSLRAVSAFHDTPPMYVLDQPAFLNACALFQTWLDPEALMALLLETETLLGRTRDLDKGPRVIDLDLVLLGELVVDAPTLTLPHPLMHERAFVLAPLSELAPEMVHPTSGLTVAQLLSRLDHAEPTP